MAALPGRAQETASSRYAFADTTLLRDTLDLSFERLFPLSDSLQVLPDTLRALSVRYVWSLERLVFLADSLGVPVDSVGPFLERERFNPLAAGAGSRNEFTYNSSYSVAQTQSSWRNSTEYGFQTGPLFVRNSTTIDLSRYRAGTQTSLRQTRNSATEVGWRFSPDFSLGGRVNLQRFDSREPSAISNVGETKNEYQISMRTRQRPIRGLASEFNVFAGLLDLQNASLEKRGLSGNLTSRIRYSAGTWLTQEVNGTVDGNLSRTRVPSWIETASTRDYSQNIRGSLSLFQSAPVGLKGNFTFRHVQVETPGDSGTIRRVLTDNGSADATVRLRRDNDRYLDLSQKISVNKQATVIGATSRNTRQDDGFSANGRYLLWGWSLDAQFQNTFGTSTFPNRTATGGYEEFLHNRSLNGTLSRRLSPKLVGKLTARIGLNSFRYTRIGDYSTLPVSRDQWRQAWGAEGTYSPSRDFSTSLGIEVGKTRYINLPSASTGTNNDTRIYKATWTWNYRLLEGLTATQRNTIGADYLEYPFLPDNNRLTLDYNTATTLNAIVTPQLSIDLQHNLRETPGGNYTLYPDGLYYFSRADETRNSTLAARIAYRPSQAITLAIDPTYAAGDRTGTVNGVEVPQRRNRTLRFSGGAIINWPISSRGQLRGDIQRTYTAERTTTYSGGVAERSPRSEFDFWNGSLQLSWRL